MACLAQLLVARPLQRPGSTLLHASTFRLELANSLHRILISWSGFQSLLKALKPFLEQALVVGDAPYLAQTESLVVPSDMMGWVDSQ